MVTKSGFLNLKIKFTKISYKEFTICLFVCLFVWGFTSHSRIFHSYGDVTITSEGLHILTFTRHSSPLSSEGSLACHTYCDTGLLFIMIITEDPWRIHLLPSVWQ